MKLTDTLDIKNTLIKAFQLHKKNNFMCFKKQLFTITVLAILMLSSCTKNNGIDNNSVIVKPYVLYFSGDRGELFKTNTKFSKVAAVVPCNT